MERTPFDFTEARIIGDRIEQNDPQLLIAGGYDHNFVINRPDGIPMKRCTSPGSSIRSAAG